MNDILIGRAPVIGDTAYIYLGQESLESGGELIARVTQITDTTITMGGETFTFEEAQRLEVLDTPV